MKFIILIGISRTILVTSITAAITITAIITVV